MAQRKCSLVLKNTFKTTDIVLMNTDNRLSDTCKHTILTSGNTKWSYHSSNKIIVEHNSSGSMF